MSHHKRYDDWVEQIPRRRTQGPYRDYGWERRQSTLPEFRDPSVHEMPYERPGRQPRRRYAELSGHHRPRFEPPGYPDEGYYEELPSPWEEGYEPSGQRYSDDWWAPGPHTGHGPRGYQTSDERIEDQVCERLTQHGQIDASEISVEVTNAEVTLSGTVDSRWTKRMTEDVADTVFGIKDIHNRLTIESPIRENRKRRVDRVGRSGVYPASDPDAPPEAEAQDMASWGEAE